MPFSPETLEEKPYNICVSCAKIGKTCDGPNFLAMTIERWCEWCRLRKDYLARIDPLEWKNSIIADKAGVAKISIDRIMSGDVKDLRISTMQAVSRVMVNGTWGQHPCALVAETEKEIYVDNPVIVAQCQHLQNTLESLAAEHKENMIAVREEAQRKIDFLREQIAFKESQMAAKDKHIEWLQSLIQKS